MHTLTWTTPGLWETQQWDTWGLSEMAARILVVDDEPSVLQTCCRVLERAGYEVQGESSGSAALEAYDSMDSPLVLLDLQMPGKGGLQTLAELRAKHPDSAVIIITGYGSKDNVVSALRLGAREFLEKPLANEALLAAVERVMQHTNGHTVRGNLRTLSLPNLIQVYCTERHAGRLRMHCQGSDGSVFFQNGQVVHATLGTRTGEQALYDLLTWTEGDFELDMGANGPIRTINTSWSALLLEGMRRFDEKHAELDGFDEISRLEGRTMSKLNDVLKEMAAEVPGFISADVVGMDGVSIGGHYVSAEFANEEASAQFTLVMKLVQKTVAQLKAGDVEDNLTTTDKAYILTRFLGDNSYYLGIAVDRHSATLGNVRMVSKQYTKAIWDAIPRKP